MKRLLFLKASLDNENTANTITVPLVEDEAFAPSNGPPSTASKSVRLGKQKRMNSAADNHRHEVTTATGTENLAITSGTGSNLGIDHEPLLQILSGSSGRPPKTSMNRTRHSRMGGSFNKNAQSMANNVNMNRLQSAGGSLGLSNAL